MRSGFVYLLTKLRLQAGNITAASYAVEIYSWSGNYLFFHKFPDVNISRICTIEPNIRFDKRSDLLEIHSNARTIGREN